MKISTEMEDTSSIHQKEQPVGRWSLEDLLGPNGPPEATESFLQPLDPHDVKALRATCKSIRSNRLLARVEADPFHRHLLQGFCHWDNRRTPDHQFGRPEYPPVICMNSHRDGRYVALCQRHPSDQPFPFCDYHQDLQFPVFMYPKLSVLFGVCESCEETLWATKHAKEWCQCEEKIERAMREKYGCADCAVYSAAKLKAISNGVNCEECFPPFADWCHADFALNGGEFGLREKEYPSEPCVVRHQPLTEERNKSCQGCKCFLSNDGYLALCRQAKNIDFWKPRTWTPIMNGMFFWCGMEGCGKLLGDSGSLGAW